MQRAITVHSYDHACAALKAAVEISVPILLISAPDAGLQSGPAWFASVVDQAVEATPGADSLDVTKLLDCGDKPGSALAALRHGVKDICFKGTGAARGKLRTIAGSYDARLIDERPEALDLLGHDNPLEACRDWLRSGSD